MIDGAHVLTLEEKEGRWGGVLHAAVPINHDELMLVGCIRSIGCPELLEE